jgi:hypothetical protein
MTEMVSYLKFKPSDRRTPPNLPDVSTTSIWLSFNGITMMHRSRNELVRLGRKGSCAWISATRSGPIDYGARRKSTEKHVVSASFPSVQSGRSSLHRFISSTPISTSSLLSDNEESLDEHVVTGYLSRILNARVYDAAVETPLQFARNLSLVCAHSLQRFMIVSGVICLSLTNSPCCDYVNIAHSQYCLLETRGYPTSLFFQNPRGLQQNGTSFSS